MRKFHTDLNENVPQPRRSRAPAAVALGLALLASPVLYEGGQVVAGKWLSLAGAHREPSTPVLNALGDWSRSTNLEARRYSSQVLGGALRPSTAVPMG
ncbi:MAG: hypothetical protein LC745_08815, partial [Planctomycetia bacterium]|nr:hypothetical protein [Planctomycetia bacterium]